MKFKLPNFSLANVLVIGDVMLDRYWYGNTERISPEAPVPIVHIQRQDDRPGGAGNVALNIAALGATTMLVGMVGNDHIADILETKLQAAYITCLLRRQIDKPTITKLRVLSQNQQLIRVDFEEGFNCQGSNPLLANYLLALERANVVIISDYGKGSLDDRQVLIKAAIKRNLPVLVDPKGSNFKIYQGATLLTPNLKEFEAVVGVCHTEAELIQKGLNLLKKLKLQALLITRGAKGMTLLRAGEPELHLPALTHEIYDVTGAGDTVIAVIGAALAAGADITMAIALANRAAGIVVGKLGAATVSSAELRSSIMRDTDTSKGVMTEEQLLIAVEGAKARGEKIVMTNGCFDILHAGHVSYLDKAKFLGQRLIVAVNDDDSVRRLKGDSRPINPLSRRMSVLAGLAAVDWVVSFSEDTPAALVGKILPDVLVKGGDYQPNNIVGADTVIAKGGRVEVLPFEDGCSTTAMIEKIKEETL